MGHPYVCGGKHSLSTPGRKKEDPATTGVGIHNVVSGVLNVATATVKLVSAMVKSAWVMYEFFRIVGDLLAGTGSGTGLGMVGHRLHSPCLPGWWCRR